MVKKLQKRNPSTDRAGTDGSDTDTMQPKKERRRLSGIFKRKDKTAGSQSTNTTSSDLLAPSSTTATNPSTDLLSPNPNTAAQNENTHSSSTVPTTTSPMSGAVHDSAYASSEAPSNSRSSNSNNNIVSVQNDGQIEGVNKNRNLAVNKATGDVLDEDTGEIVSTVTTTTTTTTTTTLVRGKDGKKELRTNVNTIPAGTTTTAASSSAAPGPSATSNRPRDNSGVSEMPADSAPRRPSVDVLPTPLSTTASRGQTPPRPTPLQTSAPNFPPNAPDLPAKSPKRLSREFDRPPGEIGDHVPPSPIVGSNAGPNFSYLNRSHDGSPSNNPPPVPNNAPPAAPFSQEPQRHSPLGGLRPQDSQQNFSGNNFMQNQAAQQGTPAPFPPPPRPQMAEIYPHGPDDYQNYTTAPQTTPGHPHQFAPNAASFSHAGNQHEGYGHPSGPPSSYGGLSTIESMSETSSVAPSASASQAPSAAPSAPASTFGSLKAAAKGLHGVGETLRGTLNNEIDTRFPRRNAEKAAIANAKNQAALDRGQSEMQGLQAYEQFAPGHRSSGSAELQRDGSAAGSTTTNSSSILQRWPLRREHSIPRKPIP
ncbi:hypothetical protein CKM354_000130100 [Cercospora kikuchii]|uniref:Uncharacterized protein n=1 Tax=Cercospora kikuchii TaxID=84275 RepID=A0A9P3CD70_9PEZI|nr:uncharacterized protein CKM354_000130100 [Cercospora kikuchii]GIZ37870.1 hypothetical protein CKM354_000130100 [Cercospora kikuchii]